MDVVGLPNSGSVSSRNGRQESLANREANSQSKSVLYPILGRSRLAPTHLHSLKIQRYFLSLVPIQIICTSKRSINERLVQLQHRYRQGVSDDKGRNDLLGEDVRSQLIFKVLGSAPYGFPGLHDTRDCVVS